MLHSNIGIGASIGNCSQWNCDDIPSGNNWWISEDDQKASKLFLRPGILLHSPQFINSKKLGISFIIHPGAYFSIPYTKIGIEQSNGLSQQHSTSYISTSNGKWCFWDIRASFDIKFNSASMEIGYGISNLDLYSSRRNLSYSGTSFKEFYPTKIRSIQYSLA